MAHSGRFTPKNPHKYKGDPTKITYRSRWEFNFMKTIDSHPDVLEWSSEEVIIPYISPIDNRMHRYFVDFWVKKRTVDGSIETEIIEIKPKSQTVPPKVQSGKPSKRYINEVYTWGVNSAKWKAAQNYAQSQGWKFKIFTEDHLGIK